MQPPGGKPPDDDGPPFVTTLPGRAPAPGAAPEPAPAKPPPAQPQQPAQPQPQYPVPQQPQYPVPRQPQQPAPQQPHYPPPPQQQPYYPPPPQQQYPVPQQPQYPVPQQPQYPVPQQQPYYPPPPPYGQPPQQPQVPPPPAGHGFIDFLKISAKRAVRLRIEPSEVLPQERAALAAVHPPVLDPTFQAFLAWRRSVLFVVACALVPLILLRMLELAELAEDPNMPDGLVTLQALPVVAEILFCAIAFMQLRSWTRWQRQRRVLAWGFALFFFAPFVVYLFPLASLFSEQIDAARETLLSNGMTEAEADAALEQAHALIGLGASVGAIMVLAPKAISLMPGLIRASLVSKMLFPGLASPGWLMVLAAPIYSLLVYVVLIMPYQITGSGWFVAALVAIIAAQFFLGRSGFKLARPQTQAQAIATVRSARSAYLLSMFFGAGFTVIAFGSNIERLNLDALSVVNLLLSFEASVLALTLIITDAVIASLDHARSLTHGTDAMEDESEAHIAAFVSAAHGDPPPPGRVTGSGPAQSSQ